MTSTGGKLSWAWTARVLATFIVWGGTVGCFAALVSMLALQFAFHPPSIDSYFLVDLTRSIVVLPLLSLYGIVFGAPAAVTTGLVYVFGSGAVRRTLSMLVVGAASGAVWAIALTYILAPNSAVSILTGMVGLFALAGAVAGPASLWLLSRWKLAAP